MAKSDEMAAPSAPGVREVIVCCLLYHSDEENAPPAQPGDLISIAEPEATRLLELGAVRNPLEPALPRQPVTHINSPFEMPRMPPRGAEFLPTPRYHRHADGVLPARGLAR